MIPFARRRRRTREFRPRRGAPAPPAPLAFTVAAAFDAVALYGMNAGSDIQITSRGGAGGNLVLVDFAGHVAEVDQSGTLVSTPPPIDLGLVLGATFDEAADLLIASNESGYLARYPWNSGSFIDGFHDDTAGDSYGVWQTTSETLVCSASHNQIDVFNLDPPWTASVDGVFATSSIQLTALDGATDNYANPRPYAGGWLMANQVASGQLAAFDADWSNARRVMVAGISQHCFGLHVLDGVVWTTAAGKLYRLAIA